MSNLHLILLHLLLLGGSSSVAKPTDSQIVGVQNNRPFVGGGSMRVGLERGIAAPAIGHSGRETSFPAGCLRRFRRGEGDFALLSRAIPSHGASAVGSHRRANTQQFDVEFEQGECVRAIRHLGSRRRSIVFVDG